MEGEIYGVIIVGTRPAGLQAAIHAARRKVSLLVLGRQHKSSAYRAHIENYCCISGLQARASSRKVNFRQRNKGPFSLMKM